MSQPSPDETVVALRSPSFEELYERYFALVWRTLRRLGVPAPQVEDAAQEVFVVVHRRLSEFDGRAPRAWLCAIARRVASDVRRQARRGEAPEDESALANASVERSAISGEREEASRVLYGLLETLEASKREVYVLAELEEMSMPEVAQALDLNLNTAYSRLRAARTAMKAACARLAAHQSWRQP